MTRTQKILRPIINWAVERFFPQHFFYGDDLAKKWGDPNDMKALTMESCAVSLACHCAKMGGDKLTVECFGVCDHGVDIGDWRVTMERL